MPLGVTILIFIAADIYIQNQNFRAMISTSVSAVLRVSFLSTFLPLRGGGDDLSALRGYSRQTLRKTLSQSSACNHGNSLNNTSLDLRCLFFAVVVCFRFSF